MFVPSMHPPLKEADLRVLYVVNCLMALTEMLDNQLYRGEQPHILVQYTPAFRTSLPQERQRPWLTESAGMC